MYVEENAQFQVRPARVWANQQQQQQAACAERARARTRLHSQQMLQHLLEARQHVDTQHPALRVCLCVPPRPQLKVVEKSGLNRDGTYLPPAIHPTFAKEPKYDMKTAMVEAEMVMGGVVSDLLEKTGVSTGGPGPGPTRARTAAAAIAHP
jgi:hypothetical protein